MNAALQAKAQASFARAIQLIGEPLELISTATTRAKDPTTGEYVNSASPVVHWSGTGSLQPTSETRSRNTSGGVEDVAIGFRAFLPYEAMPKVGWKLRTSSGRVLDQVAEPANEAGAGVLWTLFLSPSIQT